MTIKNLKSDNNNDKELIKEYWTKNIKKNSVEGRELADFTYYY